MYYNAVIRELVGETDGVNTTFATPSLFVPTTIRVMWNGQVYDKGDTRHGWTELTEQSISLATAPRTGDIIQAFYQDQDSEHLGIVNVIGTPFDPNGVLT